jgi:hypothetical protein
VGEEALSRDELEAALAAGAEARQAAEACAAIALVRQVEALISRVESRQHLVLNGEQGRKRLADAQQALEQREISAARAALLQARSFLEVAQDHASLARVAELESAVEAAEASRTSADALREADAALALADFASAKAAATAARKALLKAECSCDAVDALDSRIEAAQRAQELYSEANQQLDSALKLAQEDGLSKEEEVKERVVVARSCADRFIVAQQKLVLLLDGRRPPEQGSAPDVAAAMQDGEPDSGSNVQQDTEQASVLATLLDPAWKQTWDDRVTELMAYIAWLKDVDERRRRAEELLALAHDAFQKDDLEGALQSSQEAGEVAGKLAESTASEVEQEGLRLAADAEFLVSRVEAAMLANKTAGAVEQALQEGRHFVKEDKLKEARKQEITARNLLASMRQEDDKVKAQLEQVDALGKAIKRAEAAEEADVATSHVRQRIEAADFEGARACVMKAADALQRCEMEEHEEIVLQMLSQVSLAERIHDARSKFQRSLTEAETALQESNEAGARRALDAALQAIDGIGQEALDPDLQERLEKLQQAFRQGDEASSAAADARAALSIAEQMLAAEQVEQARASLDRAGAAIERASAVAECGADLASELHDLRARHARVSESLARGGARAEARREAGKHHAAAQRALGAHDAASATQHLMAAREQYELAGDLVSMAGVLEALAKQISDLESQQASDQERSFGDEAVTRFGEAVVNADFRLARSLLEKARAHYAAASIDMNEVLAGLENKMGAAEANAAKHTVAEESLQLAIEQVAEGNLEEAREALDIAKKAYTAAGVELMDDAIRELEADIDAELAKATAAADAKDGDGSAHDGSESDDSSDSDSEQLSHRGDSVLPSSKNKTSDEKGLWRKAYDPQTNDVYYYHTGTKATQVPALPLPCLL